MCILLYSSISIQFELLMYYALQLIATSCLSVHSLNDHPTAPSPHISFAPAPSPQPPAPISTLPQPTAPISPLPQVSLDLGPSESAQVEISSNAMLSSLHNCVQEMNKLEFSQGTCRQPLFSSLSS